MNIINEMTVGERERLLITPFDELWQDLWGTNIGIQYRGEERTSREKFESLKLGISCGGEEYTLKSLIAEANTTWSEPEWGYPKGRRNYQEKDLSCALREFEEETGYSRSTLKVVQKPCACGRDIHWFQLQIL